MYQDIFGNIRYKVNLHTHTTRSDGKKTPEEAAVFYHEHGYDAIALTDHWVYGEENASPCGLLVLSGVEYNIYNVPSRDGLFHIVGVGLDRDPALQKSASAQDAIDAINKAGGLAIVAHPAWSLNTPEHIMVLSGVDTTEIYNSVSDIHMSRRPDSSLIVDMLAAKGVFFNLIADDDTHYYEEGGDGCRSFIMAQADRCDKEALISAIRRGRFYASQGPEVHAWREGDEIVAKCSPCEEIVFFSDTVWCKRVFEGQGLTEARYKIVKTDTYVRVQVKDKEGNLAWTNCIILES